MDAIQSINAPVMAERLGRRLQALVPELSFSRAKRAIEFGQVTVDGETVRDPGQWVPPAAAVVWHRDRPAVRLAPGSQETTGPRLELLHADADVAVVNKPAGLLSQQTPDLEKDTLLSRLALLITRKSGSRPYLALVHRLDRDTSGLLAVATSRRGLESLQAQLLERSMSRVYRAVVEGELGRPAGTFDRALVGDGIRRRRWVARIGEKGKVAVTHWLVLRRFAGATEVRVALETGRTHQIRIHFAAAGHPVVGDPVYRAGEEQPMTIEFGRQALHAGELAFQHPADGRWLRFTAPPPDDYLRLIERLGPEKIPT